MVRDWDAARKPAAVRSLTVRTQASSATRASSWAVASCGEDAGAARARGCLDVVRGELRFQRGGPGFQPGDLGQAVQATIRQTPERIRVMKRIGAFGGTSVAGEAGQHGNGRGNGLHGRPAVRTGVHAPGCPSIHTHSIAGGTDNLRLALHATARIRDLDPHGTASAAALRSTVALGSPTARNASLVRDAYSFNAFSSKTAADSAASPPRTRYSILCPANTRGGISRHSFRQRVGLVLATTGKALLRRSTCR